MCNNKFEMQTLKWLKKLERLLQSVYQIGYYLNCKYLLQKFINAFSYDVIVCQLPQKSSGSKVLKLFCFYTVHLNLLKVICGVRNKHRT